MILIVYDRRKTYKEAPHQAIKLVCIFLICSLSRRLTLKFSIQESILELTLPSLADLGGS